MDNFIGNSRSHPVTTTLQEKWNYAEAVAEVETIIARIETGELELEEVFEQFEQAVEHLRQCETFLQAKQQQMSLLIETLRDEDIARHNG